MQRWGAGEDGKKPLVENKLSHIRAAGPTPRNNSRPNMHAHMPDDAAPVTPKEINTDTISGWSPKSSFVFPRQTYLLYPEKPFLVLC